MAGQRSLSFSEFFKFELKVSLLLLLFALLVGVFISVIQGVIVWDEYFLLALLFFGILYLLLGVLLALFSGIAGYLLSAGKRTTDLTFFGIVFPSTLIGVAYVTEAIYNRIALLFPDVPMGTSYAILAIASLIVFSAAWRFWLRKSSSAKRCMELLHSGIIFLALVAIWTLSMDVSFIRGSFSWPSRLAFAFPWLGIALFGFPLVKVAYAKFTRHFSLSVPSLSRGGKLSTAVFILLVTGYCFLLAKNYNPHSPDRYAIRSDAVVSSAEKPNVFLFVLDTFGADQLFEHGEERAPNLTSLFPNFVVFTQAYSPSSWTLPATSSILSCLYPTTARRVMSKSRLDLHTLPEILAEAGYHTAGVSENIVASGALFAQGFDRYYSYIRYYVCNNFALFRWMPFIPQRIILTCLRGYDLGDGKLIARIPGILPDPLDSPLFLYVHFNQAHYPYYDERSFLGGIYPGSERLAWYSLMGQLHFGNSKLEVEPEKMADMVFRYRQSIENIDRELGDLFQSLKREGLWDNSLIIITSDHGEEFLEHSSWGHGQSLYQELIHVPLLLKFPEGADLLPQLVERPVNTIDLAPTILDFLDRADLSTQMHGESLLPLIRGEKDKRREFIFSEVREDRRRVRIYTTIQNELKFILTRHEDGGDKTELYNLAQDPEEKIDSWEKRQEYLRIKSRCEEFVTSLGEEALEAESEFDSQTLERLKAMGYLR